MQKSRTPVSISQRLEKLPEIPGIIAIVGNEPLLVMEAADAVRVKARNQGYTDRQSFVMDARSDWQQVAMAGGSGSLFGDKQLIEITLPGGKPGKSGAQAIVKLAQQYGNKQADEAMLLFKLPDLDRQTQNSDWYKTLSASALVLECPPVTRQELPAWISQRLASQNQHTDQAVLAWIADHVEGNLLAAHQEILKLGLLYPAGELTLEQVYAAVMNVARYDIMSLREALLDANTARAMKIIRGLQAEGEAPLLVLWALTEDLRVLAQAFESTQTGQPISQAWRNLRVFGTREQKLTRLSKRLSLDQVRDLLKHAHEIDCLIKGIIPPGRLTDPWQECSRLALRITSLQNRIN